MIIGYANSMFTATHGILARGGTPPAALLLDTYTGAAAAYSLRLLRTAYTGDAIRVRRSSDNAEQDFGFVGNDLDTASLLTFVGAGNGFVTTWYDQSGNAQNATQATAGNQPKIVDGGVIIRTSGNIPALDCFQKQMTNTQSNTTTQATFTAQELSSTGSNASFVLPFYTISTPTFFSAAQNGSASVPYSLVGTPTFFVNNNSIIATRDSLFDNTATNNETLLSVIGGGTTTTGRNLQYTVNGFSGNFKTFEVIIYNSDQSSNRTGIESNINTFYTIY